MTVSHGTRTGFAPANEDDRSYGPITVSEATDKSVNAVYAQMGIDVGPAKVKATAVDLGIPAGTPSLASSQGAISLGTATPSVLDMTQVYATLAQHGSHRPYTLVDKITKSEQEEIELPEREETTAIPRAAADTTTSILRSVVDGGTGTAAQGAGRPAAGKTGTAEDDKAAWFAGYTPDLATVVAVLGQNPESAAQEPLYGAGGLARVNGGDYPAQIWADYTAAALNGRPVRDFDLQLEEGAEPVSPSPSGSDSASPTSRARRPTARPVPPSPPRPPAPPPGRPANRPPPARRPNPRRPRSPPTTPRRTSPRATTWSSGCGGGGARAGSGGSGEGRGRGRRARAGRGRSGQGRP